MSDTPTTLDTGETTFYVLVPDVDAPGEYTAVFADGSYCPAYRSLLKVASLETADA